MATELDICRNRHRGSSQSIAAFEQIKHKRRPARLRILAAIKKKGAFGATAEELELDDEVGLARSTVSARTSEMKVNGMIIESGRFRKTRSGSDAAVLVAAETQATLDFWK